MRSALTNRDIAAVFAHVQRYAGVSQSAIATSCGMTQARVNEIVNGHRTVGRLDVIERIADGLEMPDDARHVLGLAAKRSDLSAFPEIVRVYETQSDAIGDIRQAVENASELDVLAIRALGLMGLNDSLLLKPDPPSVRVLLLDPDCDAVAARAREIDESVDSLASGIKLTEARLRELARHCRIETYRYTALPTWRLIRADETMFASVFGDGIEGHESATYKLTRVPHGPLFHGYRRTLESLITDGERIV